MNENMNFIEIILFDLNEEYLKFNWLMRHSVTTHLTLRSVYCHENFKINEIVVHWQAFFQLISFNNERKYYAMHI